MKNYSHYNLKVQRQNGAILILVLIILGVLIATSIQFFTVTTDSTKISGSARDSSESLLLAESAMEMLRGQFINDLDRDGVVSVANCAVNGLTVDKCEAGEIRNNIATPEPSMLSYTYYTTAGGALDQTTPSILQKVADGEGAFDTTTTPLTTHNISNGVNRLRVNDLFAAGISPLLYSVNNNGLLVSSVAANWNAETSTQKAAAWIEVILNPTDNEAIDLYVQTVAQVGNARSFLQRYVGSYYNDDTLGALISPLAESSNINREVP